MRAPCLIIHDDYWSHARLSWLAVPGKGLADVQYIPFAALVGVA